MWSVECYQQISTVESTFITAKSASVYRSRRSRRNERIFTSRIHRGPQKNAPLRYSFITLINVDRFLKFFSTVGLVSKFVTRLMSYFQTSRSSHFCFPWRRPCDYHAICCTDRKTIQCLSNLRSMYLSIFNSFRVIRCLNQCVRQKNRHFYIFVFPGDAPRAITLNVVWMENKFDAYKLPR